MENVWNDRQLHDIITGINTAGTAEEGSILAGTEAFKKGRALRSLDTYSLEDLLDVLHDAGAIFDFPLALERAENLRAVYHGSRQNGHS